MEIIKSLIADCEALIARIRDELSEHPIGTQARQFVEGAREELQKHPGDDADTMPIGGADDASGG